MRIRIRHETRYRYEAPVRGLAQLLKLTPRSFEGQYVVNWRVDLSLDVPAPLTEDPFGNLVHTLFAAGPLQEFAISVEGEVETWDAHGLVRGLPDPLPPEVYLRPTDLTFPSPEISAFALEATRSERDPLGRLHALMGALHRDIRFDADATHVQTSASEAFAAHAGVCQDLSHIFISAARELDVPARYVSGHLVKLDGETRQNASHAWAEALVPGLGWVGFDAANGVCPTETHVRVATGFDYASAMPVRGVRIGGGGEDLKVELEVKDLAQAQAQTTS